MQMSLHYVISSEDFQNQLIFLKGSVVRTAPGVIIATVDSHLN